MKLWDKISGSVKLITKIFNVEFHRYKNPYTGKEHEFVILNSPDWINVVPVTSDGKILFIRQFRPGNSTISLEVPGGLVEPGETPLESAIRELKEETGAVAQDWKLIGKVYPNPAFQNNLLYTFIARDVEIKYETEFDAGEYIEIEFIPEDRIFPLIESGEINHSLVIIALFWYMIDRYKGSLLSMENILKDMIKQQENKVISLARRINSRITPDDIKNPQDFPEISNDPDFNYEDGILTGLNSVLSTIRREKKRFLDE